MKSFLISLVATTLTLSPLACMADHFLLGGEHGYLYWHYIIGSSAISGIIASKLYEFYKGII